MSDSQWIWLIYGVLAATFLIPVAVYGLCCYVSDLIAARRSARLCRQLTELYDATAALTTEDRTWLTEMGWQAPGSPGFRYPLAG